MTQTLPSSTEDNLNLGILAKEAGIALAIQFAGILLTYLVEVFLARWMGRTEFGTYEYVVAWSVLLALLAGLGLPHTVLRFVSEYQVKEEWGLLWGIVRSSWLMTILASLLVSLLAAGVILLLNYYYPFTYATPLLIGIGLIPLRALIDLQLKTARAARSVTLAYAPSRIIWPVLLIGGAFFVFETSHSLTGTAAIAIAQITLLIAILFQLGLLWVKLNQEFEASKPVYVIREWLNIALIILFNTASYTILTKTDTIMVGSILGPQEAGMYAAAVKTARWVSFVLIVINIVAAPHFAAMYAKNNIDGLQKVVSAIALWIFWPSVTISLFLILFSQSVLGIFGSEFMAASSQLKILVFGNLGNAFCGSVGYLMMMTGYQNKSAVVFVYAAVINIVLNAILILLIGAVGAAIATAFCSALWNVWLSFLVMKYVGVSPFVFRGLFPQKASTSEIET